MNLLQIATGITKCDDYYKLRQYNLPHFHVLREDKETTKVRIVYDSVAIYGGISHDSMLPGPKLSKMSFFNALLRFWSYLVALVVDLTEWFEGGGYTSLDFQKSMKQWAWRSMTAPHFTLSSTMCDNMQKITEMTTR